MLDLLQSALGKGGAKLQGDRTNKLNAIDTQRWGCHSTLFKIIGFLEDEEEEVEEMDVSTD